MHRYIYICTGAYMHRYIYICTGAYIYAQQRAQDRSTDLPDFSEGSIINQKRPNMNAKET
jgi:hypothetical protein